MRVGAPRLLGWSMASLLSVASLAAAGDVRLVEAVKNKDVEAVRTLLKRRADVNAPQGDGATALHWAAHWDDLNTASLIIQAGANVNAATDLGVTPLSLACANGSAPMVEKLLVAGAKAEAADSTGTTALMIAARVGGRDAVGALLARGAGVNAKETSRGQTALMWAVSEKHPEVVRVLLEHGADVHARSRVRRLVISRGDGGGRGTAVDTLEKGGSTALLFAARQGDVASAGLLLASGANPNDTAPDGVSALVMAAHSGHGELAALLLDKGADPNAAGAGYTALHAAVLRGDLPLTQALLAHSAAPNARLTKGTPFRRNGQDFVLPQSLVGATPFWLAARFLEVGIMRALAAGGADPLLSLEDGALPLLGAAGIGTGSVGGAEADRRGIALVDGARLEGEERVLETVKLTMELGADINGANQAGDTALHIAASKGLNTVVQFLVDKGARLDSKNKRGRTPLGITIEPPAPGLVVYQPNLKSTADLLLKLGAKE